MLNLLDLSHTQVFDAGCAALASALDNACAILVDNSCATAKSAAAVCCVRCWRSSSRAWTVSLPEARRVDWCPRLRTAAPLLTRRKPSCRRHWQGRQAGLCETLGGAARDVRVVW